MTARLVALATAVPPHDVQQNRVKESARSLFRKVLREDDDRLLGVFDHAGTRSRHACAPLEFE